MTHSKKEIDILKWILIAVLSSCGNPKADDISLENITYCNNCYSQFMNDNILQYSSSVNFCLSNNTNKLVFLEVQDTVNNIISSACSLYNDNKKNQNKLMQIFRCGDGNHVAFLDTIYQGQKKEYKIVVKKSHVIERFLDTSNEFLVLACPIYIYSEERLTSSLFYSTDSLQPYNNESVYFYSMIVPKFKIKKENNNARFIPTLKEK